MLSDKFTEITKQNGLYNIQAISNISSIMEKGILSYEKAGGIFHDSIALNEVQARRDWIDKNNFYEGYIKKSIKCAEVLVPYRVLPEYILGAVSSE